MQDLRRTGAVRYIAFLKSLKSSRQICQAPFGIRVAGVVSCGNCIGGQQGRGCGSLAGLGDLDPAAEVAALRELDALLRHLIEDAAASAPWLGTTARC